MPLEGHRSIQGMLEDTTAQKVKLIVLETNFEQTVLKFILLIMNIIIISCDFLSLILHYTKNEVFD